MGTWDSGPFNNDMAMDFIGETVDYLMAPIDAFLAEPFIDETFDPAFAAIAMLNGLMGMCSARPWDITTEAPRKAEPRYTPGQSSVSS